MTDVIKTEVLVIGGGGAAARAALEARLGGAEVILVTKGSFGAVGTRGAGATASAFSEYGVFATPGWTGPLIGGEKPQAKRFYIPADEDFERIIQVGLGMTDAKLARIIVEEGVQSRTALLGWGAAFGEYGIRSHGVPIMDALVRQIRGANITVLERTMAWRLFIKDGECLGAVCVNEMTGDTVIIRAGATIIGTGGDADLFMLNLNPNGNSGDGYAMGYEAGAELMNLEFKQIFMGTVFPNKNMILGPCPPYTLFTNIRGEEFIQRYLPEGASLKECLAQRHQHNPFSTRDTLSRYVDIAIIGEVQAGRGTERGGVFRDRSDPRNPPYDLRRNEFWEYKGIDFNRPVEVGICHHCSLGGLRINENAQTTISRLYAAGEAAAGPHGADRMGGHMLLAAQVFGARAGKHAAVIKGKKLPEIDNRAISISLEPINRLRKMPGNYKPADMKKELQKLAYFKLLLIRNKEELNGFIGDISNINQELKRGLSINDPRDLIDALELENLLSLAEIEAAVCLARTESRGPHYREDFPFQDDNNWLKSITAKKVNGGLQLGAVALHPDWKSLGDDKVKDWG